MNKQLAKAVRERARFLCEYCISPEFFCPDPFEFDHVLAEILGGKTELRNLAYACSGCNGYKFTSFEALDPGTGQIVPLFNPRKDVWDEHFVWNEDFTLIIGVTPTGRATVSRLRLNRLGVVNLRRVLASSGDHPPVLK